MAKCLDYNPDQAYLLPPSVRDVLGSGHLCFLSGERWPNSTWTPSERSTEKKAGQPTRRRCWFRFGCTPTPWA
jgi:hypothetical protein